MQKKLESTGIVISEIKIVFIFFHRNFKYPTQIYINIMIELL